MKFRGHVYQHNGPIAAHDGLKKVNRLFIFRCSCLLPTGMQVSVDGTSLKVLGSAVENDANVVYAEQV